MKKQIKIVVKRVGQKPTVETVKNELETLQEIVGGYIEIPYSSELPEGVNLVCNEEGKILELDPNILWGDSDIICGDCFFMAHDENGDATDLTDEQVEQATSFAITNEISDDLIVIEDEREVATLLNIINSQTTANKEGENKIAVLVKRVGEPPVVEVIENTSEVFQKTVGGSIEVLTNPDLPKGVRLVLNEEEKCNYYKPNIFWGENDLIFGDILYLAHDEDGKATSLTKEQIKQAMEFTAINDASDFFTLVETDGGFLKTIVDHLVERDAPKEKKKEKSKGDMEM